jgi:hypothetical protein
MSGDVIEITAGISRMREPARNSLPGPCMPEIIEGVALEIIEVQHDLSEASRPHNGGGMREELPGAIARAERLLGRDLRTALEAALAPATHDDVADALESLVGAFPNSKADALFGRLLVADVGALRPSRGALDAACRRLRRTFKFLPAIAEICDAIDHAEKYTYRNALDYLEKLPRKLAAGKEAFMKYSDKKQIDAAKQARRVESQPRTADPTEGVTTAT